MDISEIEKDAAKNVLLQKMERDAAKNVIVQQENTLNIYQRLHAIMTEFDYVQKTRSQSGIKYTFVAHDSVTTKLHPLLVKYRVVAIPRIVEHTFEAPLTSIKLEVAFVNIDSPNDYVRTDAIGYGIDQQDKGPGKAISYAYKYCILKALCLETGDDPENDNVDLPAKFATQSPNGAVSEGQVKLIFARMNASKKVNKDQLEQFVLTKGAKRIEELPKTLLNDVLKYVENG